MAHVISSGGRLSDGMGLCKPNMIRRFHLPPFKSHFECCRRLAPSQRNRSHPASKWRPRNLIYPKTLDF